MANGAFGIQVRDNVVRTIEQLIPAAANKPAGARVEPTIRTVHHNSCDLPTSVAQIQALFNGGPANSVSIVFCGESHLYQQQTRPVRSARLSGRALGEDQRTWDKSDQDRQRAAGLLQTMGGVVYPAPDLVVIERGMEFDLPEIPATAREENLTGTLTNPQAGYALFPGQRSFMAAGYIFLCVAGGDQNHHDRVVVFFGEHHQDIITHFEYFARHSSADWVQKRPRRYLIIPSHVQ